jgi:hypothetical protein
LELHYIAQPTTTLTHLFLGRPLVPRGRARSSENRLQPRDRCPPRPPRFRPSPTI